MKALRLSLLFAASLTVSSCAPFKEAVGNFDYAIGSQGSGYFLTIAPKSKPPTTSAKAVTDPRP